MGGAGGVRGFGYTAVIAAVLVAAFGLAACGSSAGGASRNSEGHVRQSSAAEATTGGSGSTTAGATSSQHGSSTGSPPAGVALSTADAVAQYLNSHLDLGCTNVTYTVQPGRAVHPATQGETAQSLNESPDLFAAQNRVNEQAVCLMSDHSGLNILQLNGSGLPLSEYQQWLSSAILPAACPAGSAVVGGILDIIWKTGNDMWNIEPSALNSPPAQALPLPQREALANKIAQAVHGVTVLHQC